MNYISAEEFSKQDKKAQKVLLDWWKPSIGDICAYKMGRNIKEYFLWKKTFISCERDIKGIMYDIPLLTEGQIRQFIEDKTGCKVVLLNNLALPIEIWLINKDGNRRIFTDKHDVLQAYWQVAVKIAKEDK